MTVSTPTFYITDHALLRWLERVHDIDVEGFRELMRAEVETSIYRFDAEAAKSDATHTFVMDGDRVVTCLEPGWRANKRRAPFAFAVPRVTG